MHKLRVHMALIWTSAKVVKWMLGVRFMMNASWCRRRSCKEDNMRFDLADLTVPTSPIHYIFSAILSSASLPRSPRPWQGHASQSWLDKLATSWITVGGWCSVSVPKHAGSDQCRCTTLISIAWFYARLVPRNVNVVLGMLKRHCQKLINYIRVLHLSIALTLLAFPLAGRTDATISN